MKPIAGPPKLNFDLLAEVISQVWFNEDLWALSQTGRTLHSLATREILRRGVKLDQVAQLTPFYHFMTSDLDHRSRYLRKLEINLVFLDFNDRHDSTVLADILLHCKGLRQLTMASGAVLALDPRIGTAISSLQELSALVLSLAGEVKGQDEILAGLQTHSLNIVEIDYSYDPGLPPSMYTRGGLRNPTIALRRHAATLETLRLASGLLATLGSQSSACYMNVTTLQLEDTSIPGISVLMSTFPNLRRFEARNVVVDGSYADRPTEHGFRVVPWRHLQHLEATLELVSELDIPCTVQRFLNESVVALADPHELDTLLSFMIKTRLAQLSTTLAIIRFAELNTIVQRAGSLCLTHLSLELGLRWQAYSASEPEALVVSTSLSTRRPVTDHAIRRTRSWNSYKHASLFSLIFRCTPSPTAMSRSLFIQHSSITLSPLASSAPSSLFASSRSSSTGTPAATTGRGTRSYGPMATWREKCLKQYLPSTALRKE